MRTPRKTVTAWNTKKMQADLDNLGWLRTDLAGHADVSDMTVSRFFRGKQQNPRTAKKLADAMGFPLSRYRRGRRRIAAQKVAS